MAWEYGQQIWNALNSQIHNEIGVAGLMGNLVAESGLIPFRLQGDYIEPYVASTQYTANVDDGTISEDDFVNNGPNGGGYGLAQWTYHSRKQGLYNMKVSTNTSIGSVELAVAYLMYELTNSYPTVLNALINATSIREASDTVLHDFEDPADQSEAVEILRAGLAQSVYDEYNGTPQPQQRKRFKWWLYVKQL